MMRLVAALCALFVAELAAAGQWETLGGDRSADCHFRFTGQVLPGDLTGYIDTIANGPQSLPRICLNSEGGSLSEVYRFIKRINNGQAGLTVATRVESGAVCLSSCAILFMFGQTFGANSPYPSREIEPGARLGFHSPFIAPGKAGSVAAADAFRVALDVSKLLADSSYTALTTAGSALPPELLGLVLGTPGDDMRYVDKVGELKILDIEMVTRPDDGVVLANDAGVIGGVVKRICASSHVLSNRTHFVEDGYQFGDLVEVVNTMKSEGKVHHLILKPAEEYYPARIVAMASGPYTVPGWYSAGAILFCQVEINVEQVSGGFRVSGYTVGFGGPNFDWDSRLATGEEIESRGLAVGLVPIDHAYR